jgi:pimeloyl-ACP methyl ester carboxylesterase
MKEGPAFVFQHGLCGDASQPADVFPDDTGWRCLNLECRGHGRSEAGPFEELSIATFTSDLTSWIEQHEPAPVVLGGISMGAAIALRLAVLHPGMIRALVLARPAWIDKNAPPNMQPYAVVGDLLRRYPPDEARSRFEDSDTAHKLADEAPDNLASLRSFFSRQPVSTTAELLRRISADGPNITRKQIGSIQIPTLVIGTARDVVHPLAMAKELAAIIPHSNMVEITPKADSRERYRDEFSAALSAFLKSV